MARKITKEEEEALKLLKGEIKEEKKAEMKNETEEKKPEVKREADIFREFIPMIKTKATAPILPFEKKGKLEEQIGFTPSTSRKTEEKEEIKYSPTFGEHSHYEKMAEEEGKLPDRAIQVERKMESRGFRHGHAAVEIDRWHELNQERGMERDIIEQKYETSRPETSTELPFMKKEELKKYKRR
jgi:hypothetical protein